MFKNQRQTGLISILYSVGGKPLKTWHEHASRGHIKTITDNDIKSQVVEIEGADIKTNYIACPEDPKKTLGIKLPFLVMNLKNLKKHFTFEVEVLDDKKVCRRFMGSTYQSKTRVNVSNCTFPVILDDGWNQVHLNLADFTRRAFGTQYIETQRIKIHASCRIRRVYFADRLYSEEELPAEFKLFLPLPSHKSEVKKITDNGNCGKRRVYPKEMLPAKSNHVPVLSHKAELSHGHIKRITDNDINSEVWEIEGADIKTNYIARPEDPKKTLGIKLPFLAMNLKNLKKHFAFEVEVLDDRNVSRRFTASTSESKTRVNGSNCTFPVMLDDGWNQVHLNLADFTRRAFGTKYIETLRIKIHACCRVSEPIFSPQSLDSPHLCQKAECGNHWLPPV